MRTAVVIGIVVAALAGWGRHAVAGDVVEIGGQRLYVSDTGAANHPCIVLVHGGPGYNSWSMERALTDTLLVEGWRVLAYDQRGSGRSPAATSPEAYCFDTAAADLVGLLDRKGIRHAVLFGHSFGTTVAMATALRYPDRITGLVLADGPISYPYTFRTILERIRTSTDVDSASRATALRSITGLDTASTFYASACFQWAMRLGCYQTPSPLPIGQRTMALVKSDTGRRYASMMTIPPTNGFVRNERYTILHLGAWVDTLRRRRMPMAVLIGADDGLFDEHHRQAWQRHAGAVTVVDHASHSVFIDRPDMVVTACRELRSSISR